MNKYLRAGATLVVVQAVLIGGYLLLGNRNGAQHAPAAVAPEPVSAPLPDLTLRYIDGSSGNLSDLRGRPLLIHFWATWCPPCRKELPDLAELADKRGAHILLVALDANWAPVRRFLDRPVPAYIALADGSEVERRFGVRKLPQSIVVDRHGNMTLRFRGAQDWTSKTTLELLPTELR